MAFLKKYQNKKIAIYGMGATGFSVAKVFKKLKAQIFCWDDNKKIRKKMKNLNLPPKRFWQNKSLIDNIVISPGIDINKCKIKYYLKKNLKKIITDLDIFYSHYFKNRNITITGTNGKSTTAKILHNVLLDQKKDARLVGNIGNPLLSEKKINKKTIFVIEVSSYQLEYSKIFSYKAKEPSFY